MQTAHAWLLLLVLVAGCATNQPVIYAGKGGGDRAASTAAVADCSHQAEAAGVARFGANGGAIAANTVRNAAVGAAGGAVGGALAGNALQGAGIGAASAAAVSLVQNFLAPPAPNPAYRAYVERCLHERVLETVGWQ